MPRHLCLKLLQRGHGDLAVAQPDASRRATGTTLLRTKGFVSLFGIKILHYGTQYGRASVTRSRHSSLCHDTEL